MDLTPRQQQVHDLHVDGGLSLAKVAVEMGITRDSAKSAWRDCRRKLGIERDPKRHGKPIGRLETKHPEKAAELLDIVTEPGFENLAEAIREAELPPDAARAFMARIQGQYQPIAREADRIKTEVLVRGFEGVATKALGHITEEKLEDLDAYKLTLVAAIATDKRELLDGRPTERISVEDRRALTEIMPVLLAEAQRRGLSLEANPETQQVHAGFREDAPYQVRAGRERMDPIEAEVT